MNDAKIIKEMDSSFQALILAGHGAARASKRVLKAVRHGLNAFPADDMAKRISDYSQQLVNHAEPDVQHMYSLFQRSVRNAAKDANLVVKFSKKNSDDKKSKVVEVTLTKVEPTTEQTTEPTIEQIPSQPNPKPVATGKDQSGAAPTDHMQSVDETSIEDKQSVRTIAAAIDTIKHADNATMSPDEVYQLIERFYGSWSVEGRQAFVQRVVGLIERTEKKDKKVA